MRILKVLVQTTIPAKRDNWTIDSFLLLREHLASLQEMDTRFEVTARNRDTPIGAPDAVLSRLGESDFDELWLFALDFGEGGLTPDDCAGISRFRQRGGGILSARDHQDLGISLCTLGGVGRAHFFHTKNPEPDVSRRTPDDRGTPAISWPNYHSGRNGDFQRIVAAEPVHESESQRERHRRRSSPPGTALPPTGRSIWSSPSNGRRTGSGAALRNRAFTISRITTGTHPAARRHSSPNPRARG